MNIALFGTSGDPPTIGHQRILEWLSDNYDLVVVWVSNNPFKSHQTNLEDRIAMMRLLIDEIIAESDRHNLELHPEISNSYSLITVEKAQQIWHNADFTLVIGGDLIEQIVNWYQAEKLLQQVKILVVVRRGYHISESQIANFQNKGVKVAIADLVVPEISSTNYRKNGDQSGIIPSIAQYIYTNNLYQWEETNPNTP